ncbi:MAG: TetR/AcrR family transcriptional regulator [Acidimicrobiales bacterium]
MVESGATDPRPTPERILGAALAAFADRGVEATSLDSLAAEIGIRKQTILYWFPSKEQLLLGVVDHAVAQLGARLSEAAVAAGPVLADRVVAVVGVTFRLGRTHPQLLAVVREVIRVGPPASTHLATAVEPLVATATAALGPQLDPDQVRRVLLAAGAHVVGLATEAEVRADLGMAADLAWLRARRRALIDALVADLG